MRDYRCKGCFYYNNQNCSSEEGRCVILDDSGFEDWDYEMMLKRRDEEEFEDAAE